MILGQRLKLSGLQTQSQLEEVVGARCGKSAQSVVGPSSGFANSALEVARLEVRMNFSHTRKEMFDQYLLKSAIHIERISLRRVQSFRSAEQRAPL